MPRLFESGEGWPSFIVHNSCNNIASKAAMSHFIYVIVSVSVQWCMFMAWAKLTSLCYISIGNVWKQLTRALSCAISSYDAVGKFGEDSRSFRCSRLRLELLFSLSRALQTSRVRHNSMDAKAWINFKRARFTYFLTQKYNVSALLVHSLMQALKVFKR